MAPTARDDQNIRQKLAAAIRERLSFDEDWTECFPPSDPPQFLALIADHSAFEEQFDKVIESGCRWDVLMFCLETFFYYNTVTQTGYEEVVHGKQETAGGAPVVFTALEPSPDGRSRFSVAVDDETRIAKRTLVKRTAPPASDERAKNESSLAEALAIITRCEGTLVERGKIVPPPFMLSIGTEEEQNLFAVEAPLVLQSLLRWARTLLVEQSANFRSVENAGRVLPCIYMEEVIRQKVKGHRAANKQDVLEPIAWLLNTVDEAIELAVVGRKPSRRTKKVANYDAALLRLYTLRFAEQYPREHKEIVRRLKTLHGSPAPAQSEWREWVRAAKRSRPS